MLKSEQVKKATEEALALQAKWLEQSFKTAEEYNALVKAGMKYWTDLATDFVK